MKENKLDYQYRKNFITEVIFRIDFFPILIINEKKPINLQEDIRDLLPEFNENKLIDIKATITDNQVINEPERRPEWRFSNIDKTISANLSFDNLNIVTKYYKNYENFKDVLFKVTKSFYENYKPVNIKRIGLRYINKINFKDGDPLDWEGYINNNLTCQLKIFNEVENSISRSMGQIVLNNDQYNIIFNYGIYNPEFPAKVARKEFILDYDCYTNNCEFEGIEDILVKFNLKIKELFEDSIEEKLREVMEIER
ncbi:MAG TPA: TIGR04255 family protein [Candidatus Methanofastidiosum sp.]|nr:TIGR04255 family protein [Methanofastidiosum sp.]